jgi:hypothetical protein
MFTGVSQPEKYLTAYPPDPTVSQKVDEEQYTALIDRVESTSLGVPQAPEVQDTA